MAEKELIQKLRLLNAVEPNKEWVFSARKRMISLMDEDSEFSQLHFLGLPFLRFAGVAVPMVVILIFAGGLFIWGGSYQGEGVRAIISKNSPFPLPFVDDSKSAFVNNEQSSEIKHSVNTAIVSENFDEKEFQKILFRELEEKLLILGQQVSEISGSGKLDTASELLSRAQDAFNEGDLIEAFDVFVALERFLNQ